MIFSQFLIVLIFFYPWTNFWVISSNTYFSSQILSYLFNLLLNISTAFLTYRNSIFIIPYSLLIFSGVSIISLNILNLFFFILYLIILVTEVFVSLILLTVILGAFFVYMFCDLWLWVYVLCFIYRNYLKLELQLTTLEKICAFLFFVSCLGIITTCNYF